MDLSIIIINYNTQLLTRQCIDSIYEKTHDIQFEVILVDNASTDGSKEYFEKDSRIKYIYNNDNLGFGKANNIGYEHSTGDIVLCLNSDTIVINGILKDMVQFIRESPNDIGVFGIILFDNANKPNVSSGSFPLWYNEFLIKKHKKNSRPFDKVGVVDYITGADLFVRRGHVEELGLFDPDFFMYYEDTELCYRYKQKGYNSFIADKRGIIHLEGASGTNSYRRTKTMTESYFTYMSKTLPKFKWKLVRTLILFRRFFTTWKYDWTIKEKAAYFNSMIKHK